MKKSLSFALVLAICISCFSSLALAADQPFQSGVYYGEKFRGEYGAQPSMLNFGYAKLSPGESLYDAKTTTIKKMKASDIVKRLDSYTYYCYAKWQFAEKIDFYTIDAMLVMTSPSDDYYATYSTWEIEDFSPKTICSWFFDVTDCLRRCRDDNGGTLERGEYAFSLFFNDMSFRVVKVKLT